MSDPGQTHHSLHSQLRGWVQALTGQGSQSPSLILFSLHRAGEDLGPDWSGCLATESALWGFADTTRDSIKKERMSQCCCAPGQLYPSPPFFSVLFIIVLF